MSSDISLKCHCNSCGGDRHHRVLHSHDKSNDEFTHELIECMGCGNVSYRRAILGTEGDEVEEVHFEEIYPEVAKGGRLPIDFKYCSAVPAKIEGLYHETLSCVNERNRILAVAGMRALVEAICLNEELKTGNLVAKINALQGKGRITKQQADALHEIRFFGNAALHEIEAPKNDELILALEVIEAMISHLFIAPTTAKLLKQQRTGRWDDEEEDKAIG